MVAAFIYMVRFYWLSRGAKNGVNSNALTARMLMFVYIFFLMTLLFFSDVCSVYVNMNSNGVSTPNANVNRIGQWAMFFQLVAMAGHLLNRLWTYKHFQSVLWYPDWLMYPLMLISVGVHMGVASWIMYLVYRSPPSWPKNRMDILGIPFYWFLALDAALTICSIWILTRIRNNLAKNRLEHRASLPQSAQQAIRHSRTVIISLFLSMIIGIILVIVVIRNFKEYPYVIQIALRIYFLSYVHYLLTLRAIMRAHRETEEIKTWNAETGLGSGSGFPLTEKPLRSPQRESFPPMPGSPVNAGLFGGGAGAGRGVMPTDELDITHRENWAEEQYRVSYDMPVVNVGGKRASAKSSEGPGWSLRNYPEDQGMYVVPGEEYGYGRVAPGSPRSVPVNGVPGSPRSIPLSPSMTPRLVPVDRRMSPTYQVQGGGYQEYGLENAYVKR
ncbi:hypothetical protein HDV00_001792 [Rhizophlyctis rosea]|nr:hypothetical protein HDV00_001792 [Rhizophlyctis rosea]